MAEFLLRQATKVDDFSSSVLVSALAFSRVCSHSATERKNLSVSGIFRTFAAMNRHWDDIRVIAFDADDTLWDCQSWLDELLKQAQQNGSITIEKNMIVGIDNKVFEI